MTNPISDSLPSWAARITDDQGEMVDRTPLNGSNGRTRTFEVQVELPSGPYNDYVYDAKRRAFRLQAVVSPEHSLPADCGALVGTMGSDGRPLAALLLVSGPTVPGCLVDARVLGGVELASGETRIVAGITITGDSVCRATNVDYRLDTESARAFLGEFVTLP